MKRNLAFLKFRNSAIAEHLWFHQAKGSFLELLETPVKKNWPFVLLLPQEIQINTMKTDSVALPLLLAKSNLNFASKSYVLPSCSVLCLVTQSCLTLWDPLDYNLPGSSVHGDSPGKNTRMGCHAFLQGIFQTQGPNPGLLHCRLVIMWATRKA